MTEPVPASLNYTPPRFVNAMMKLVLRSPLHGMVSRSILLITFTGRTSGKQYTTPVSYLRDGDTVIILVKRFRTWWRNFETPAPVTLRLQGQDVSGTATVSTDPEDAIAVLATSIAHEPRAGRTYAVDTGPDRQPNMQAVRNIAPHFVVVRVQVVEG